MSYRQQHHHHHHHDLHYDQNDDHGIIIKLIILINILNLCSEAQIEITIQNLYSSYFPL